jgi:ParB/Sulfiredoxin domain
MSARLIENLLVGQLRPWPRNARAHSRKQIRQIAESIRRFGFTNPVLVDGENRILAGHGRVEAARELGMATVPCLRIEHMSAAEKRAYVLADNKLAINAGWDEELLALELKELMEADLGFDIGVTGFTIPEVDQLMEGLAPAEPGARRMTGCRTSTGFLLDASQAICGVWGRIVSFAATRSIPESWPHLWTVRRRKWSSPTHPTMSRSKAT